VRIALLSDIHGNSLALDAVLADVARQGGVDAHWVLGDLAALGHDPAGVLERLSALPGVRIIRGNTDRYVATGERPAPTLAEVQANPALAPTLLEITASFAWTQGVLSATGWLDWLGQLPLELRETLPDGTRFLGVHAAPGTDDGPGIPPDMRDADLDGVLTGCDADLICTGHVHWVQDRRVGGRHAVNPGSVSNPPAPDLRAAYAILHAEPSGYRLQPCHVEYDREAVVAAVQRLRHPGAAFIIRHMRGQSIPRWARGDERVSG
jgi:predicted phosphodiesterase